VIERTEDTERSGYPVLSMFNRALARFARWLPDQLAELVPEDMIVCECECRKLDCTEWKTCERRLKYSAGQTIKSKRIESIETVR
jgi:hypothetical protein